VYIIVKVYFLDKDKLGFYYGSTTAFFIANLPVGSKIKKAVSDWCRE
jgi:hypothetical protein